MSASPGPEQHQQQVQRGHGQDETAVPKPRIIVERTAFDDVKHDAFARSLRGNTLQQQEEEQAHPHFHVEEKQARKKKKTRTKSARRKKRHTSTKQQESSADGANASTTPPSLLEDLIYTAESDLNAYDSQLHSLKRGKEVFHKVAYSGEFTQEQVDVLVLGLHRLEASLEPILEQITSQIRISQQAWHQKSTYIDEAVEAQLIDEQTWQLWRQVHDRLGDKIDQLVGRLN